MLYTHCRTCEIEFKHPHYHRQFCSIHCRWIDWDIRQALKARERARERVKALTLVQTAPTPPDPLAGSGTAI